MSSTMSAPVRSYGFGTTLDLPYQQAVERTRVALKAQGFAGPIELVIRDVAGVPERSFQWQP